MSDDSKDALLTPTHFLPVDDNSRTPPSRGRGFKKVSKSPSSNRATPSVLGPINPKLPDYKPNKKGELVLQKWSDSQHSDDTRENRSRVKAEVLFILNFKSRNLKGYFLTLSFQVFIG